MNVKENLSRLLKAHGVTQAALAEGLEMPTTTVSYQMKDPSVEFACKACRFLGEPEYKAFVSAEELGGISGVNPVIAPIVEELNHATAYPKTIQAHLFGGILAQLKKIAVGSRADVSRCDIWSSGVNPFSRAQKNPPCVLPV